MQSKSESSQSSEAESATIQNVSGTVSKEEENHHAKDASKSTINPHTWNPIKRYLTLILVSIVGLLGPLTSSIYIPAILQVRDGLGTTTAAANSTISLYILFLGIGPLFWAPLSEIFGRRPIYLISVLLYVATTVGCALSVNIGMFIAMRILQSIGASSAQSVAGGTVADLFPVKSRGFAMGIFSVGYLVGPILGPMLGGILAQLYGWRWVFWFLVIVGGATLVVSVLFMPETHFPKASLRRACSFNPLEPLVMLRYPAVLFIACYSGVLFGLMYLYIAILDESLLEAYGFSSSQVGLGFIAPGIGNIVGTLVGGRYTDHVLEKLAEKNGGKRKPEMRLQALWVGIPFAPLGLLIYGWCVETRVHYTVPLIGLFLNGVGLMIASTVGNTYIVDALFPASASAMGCANFVRCVIATITPLFAAQMRGGLGDGWTMTVAAIVSVVVVILPILVSVFGERWRPAGADDQRRVITTSPIGEA